MQHAGHKRSASEREAADEDFIIHCSQSYTRTASQSIPGSDASQVHVHSMHAACMSISSWCTMMCLDLVQLKLQTHISALYVLLVMPLYLHRQYGHR